MVSTRRALAQLEQRGPELIMFGPAAFQVGEAHVAQLGLLKVEMAIHLLEQKVKSLCQGLIHQSAPQFLLETQDLGPEVMVMLVEFPAT